MKDTLIKKASNIVNNYEATYEIKKEIIKDLLAVLNFAQLRKFLNVHSTAKFLALSTEMESLYISKKYRLNINKATKLVLSAGMDIVKFHPRKQI